MDAKITRMNKDKNLFLFEFDKEFMNNLSEEAQHTCTSMKEILHRRVLPVKQEAKNSPFRAMGHEFAKRWVRYPQVIRRYITLTARNAHKPISVAYVVNLITGSYKNNREEWNEDLEAYGEVPPRSPYSYFTDTIGTMVDLLVSSGAATGCARGFVFESEERLAEFIDNDVNFGEWQDDCYGLRVKEPVAPGLKNVSIEDEEDTFD